MRKRKLKPDDPEFMARILEGIHNMTDEELEASMNWRHEGVEEGDMNAELAAFDPQKLAELREEWIIKMHCMDEEEKKRNKAA